MEDGISIDAKVAAIAWSRADEEFSLLPGVNGECMSGVCIFGTVGNVAGKIFARAAGGTIPAKLDEVIAATAFAAAAALLLRKPNKINLYSLY